jgi:hypothetical protein
MNHSGFQQVIYKPEEQIKRQEVPVMNVPVMNIPPMVDPNANYVNHVMTVQNIQLQSQLQYAQLRYQALVNSFMNGGNI